MIETVKNLGLSIGKVVLIAFTAICALFVTLAFLRIGLIYAIYTMVEDWTAVRLGFDYKEKRRQETFKTVVNVAQPLIERLTRRKN